jgi:hypothetical protein
MTLTRLGFLKALGAALGVAQGTDPCIVPKGCGWKPSLEETPLCKEGEERCPICGKCQKPIDAGCLVGDVSDDYSRTWHGPQIASFPKLKQRVCTATGCVYVKQEKK